MPSSKTTTNTLTTDDDDEDDYEQIPITLRLKKNFAQVLRLLVNYYDDAGDIDKFTSEEVSKIILALVEASSLSTSFSDELKQQIQSLLKDEKI